MHKGLLSFVFQVEIPFQNLSFGISSHIYEKEIAIDIFTNGISITDRVERLAPDFDNGSPKSEIRWEQRLQQPMLGGYEHNSGGCCTIGKCHCNR